MFLGAWFGHFWGIVGVSVGVGAAVVLNFLLMLQLCLSITGASWGKISVIHARHLGVAIFVGGIVWCVKIIGDWIGLPVVFVVAAGVGSAGAVTFGIVLYFRSVFGNEGEWLWDLVLRQAGPLATQLGIGNSVKK